MADLEEGQVENQGAEGAQEADTPPKSIFDQYRERIDAGETVFAPKEEDDAAKEPPPEGEEEAEAEDGGVVSEGEEEEEADDGADEGAGEAEADVGGEAGEGDDDGEAEGEGEEGESLVVTLNGRNPGETVDIEVEDKATADLLRQNANEGLRREELNKELARVQADREEIEEIDTLLTTDPAGFILERVTPDLQIQVVKALLLDDKVFEAVRGDLDGYETDEARELARLRSKDERRETSAKAKQQLDADRVGRKAVTTMQEKIVSLIPAGVADAESRKLQMLGLNIAEAACNRLKRINLSEDELVAALEDGGLLKAIAAENGGEPPPRKKGRGAGTVDPDKAQERIAGLKKAKRRRKSVAASSPAGVGSPPATIELPKNQSVNDRIKHVRKHGLGSIMGGKRKG